EAALIEEEVTVADPFDDGLLAPVRRAHTLLHRFTHHDASALGAARGDDVDGLGAPELLVEWGGGCHLICGEREVTDANHAVAACGIRSDVAVGVDVQADPGTP